MDILSIILTAVFILVGLALIWLIVEIARTVRTARKTVTDVSEKIEPTLGNIQKITTDVQPVIKKVDPLMERVSLTVDAANLEIMRVDEILEDVSQITGAVTKTMDAVDNVTSAPLDLVSNVTKKVRKRFQPKYASDESVELGKKAEGAASASDADSKADANPVVQFVDEMTDATVSAVKEHREHAAERKQKAADKAENDEMKQDQMADTASRIMNEASYQVSLDTDELH